MDILLIIVGCTFAYFVLGGLALGLACRVGLLKENGDFDTVFLCVLIWPAVVFMIVAYWVFCLAAGLPRTPVG